MKKEEELEKELANITIMAKKLSNEQIAFVMREAKAKFSISDAAVDLLGVTLIVGKIIDVEFMENYIKNKNNSR